MKRSSFITDEKALTPGIEDQFLQLIAYVLFCAICGKTARFRKADTNVTDFRSHGSQNKTKQPTTIIIAELSSLSFISNRCCLKMVFS